MSLKGYQGEVDKWVKQFNPPYWPPLEQFARLSEEVGELARELNNIHGIKKKKEEEVKKNLEDELIDVIFTIICIANSHNIDLEEAWRRMVEEKMNFRDLSRFNKNEE